MSRIAELEEQLESETESSREAKRDAARLQQEIDLLQTVHKQLATARASTASLTTELAAARTEMQATAQTAEEACAARDKSRRLHVSSIPILSVTG